MALPQWSQAGLAGQFRSLLAAQDACCRAPRSTLAIFLSSSPAVACCSALNSEGIVCALPSHVLLFWDFKLCPAPPFPTHACTAASRRRPWGG